MTDRPYVIVRTYSAGVHFGELVRREWKEVELANCRRLWRWESDDKKLLSLHEVSLHGVPDTKGAVSEEIYSIILTEAVEVIPCTQKAEKKLRKTPARSLR